MHVVGRQFSRISRVSAHHARTQRHYLCSRLRLQEYSYNRQTQKTRACRPPGQRAGLLTAWKTRESLSSDKEQPRSQSSNEGLGALSWGSFSWNATHCMSKCQLASAHHSVGIGARSTGAQEMLTPWLLWLPRVISPLSQTLESQVSCQHLSKTVAGILLSFWAGWKKTQPLHSALQIHTIVTIWHA